MGYEPGPLFAVILKALRDAKVRSPSKRSRKKGRWWRELFPSDSIHHPQNE